MGYGISTLYDHSIGNNIEITSELKESVEPNPQPQCSQSINSSPCLDLVSFHVKLSQIRLQTPLLEVSFYCHSWWCNSSLQPCITLFRFITMFCGTDNISRNILHIQSESAEYFVEYCQSHVTLLWIWIMLCTPPGTQQLWFFLKANTSGPYKYMLGKTTSLSGPLRYPPKQLHVGGKWLALWSLQTI